MREYPKIRTVFKRDPATDMETLLEGQYSEDALDYLAGNEWVWTEKVDGMNIRVMVASPESSAITFGGKTDNALLPATLVTRLQERFFHKTDLLHEIFPDGGCLYGEGYGAKIQQGGGKYRPDQDFVLFDVKVGDWWLRRADVELIATKLVLDVVPIIGRGTLGEMVAFVRGGFDSQWGAFGAEGIVARPACELRTRAGHRIITKLKHRDFVAG